MKMVSMILGGLCWLGFGMIAMATSAVQAQTNPPLTQCEIEEEKSRVLSEWQLYDYSTGKPRPPSPHPDTAKHPAVGLVGLRAFVAANPAHICIERYRKALAGRDAKIAAFAADGSTAPREAKLLPGVRIITEGDYPPRAINQGLSGKVTVELFIERDGMPEICTITSSSAVNELDNATCRAFMRRGRFDPARDGSGKPVSSKLPRSITWAP